MTAGFLNSVYSAIGFDVLGNRFGPGGLQTACDEAEFKFQNSVEGRPDVVLGRSTPFVGCEHGAWKECYKHIRAVNVFLQNIDGVPMAESAKTLYKAEARFLRAWYYLSSFATTAVCPFWAMSPTTTRTTRI